MKIIIQKLRIFNEKNNQFKKKLNMPKINYNINHKCCFTLKKIDNNKRKNYTMINNKIKDTIKNKSLIINKSKYIQINLKK